MNQLKHIVCSLPRHAPPSHPIGAVSSGYQINSQCVFRNGSDFLRSGDLPCSMRSRSLAGYGGKNDAQTLSLGKPKIALTRCRTASTDRVGNSNVPLGSVKSNDSKETSKASSTSGKQVPQLAAVPEPRKYAKLIADYSAAMEKQNLNSKSKALSTGLLSRLPIESLVSSLRPFEKRSKSKLANSGSIAVAANSNAKQSNHALTKNTLKTEIKRSLASVKSTAQKRDYVTKNRDADGLSDTNEPTEDLKNKIADSKQPTSNIPNDFDIFCDLTEKRNKQKNNLSEWSVSGGIDHKVKAPSSLVDDFELPNTTLDDNQCQFHIVASKEKIELQIIPSTSDRSSTTSQKLHESDVMENLPKPRESNHTHNSKNKAFPWWAIPEATLKEKYEKDDTISSYNTPEIKVIYSEEMSDFDVARQNEKSPSLSDKSHLKRPEKRANISKIKQYVKEELEKQRNKQERQKSVDKMTNIDGKEVEDGKSRWINERSGDKTAKLSKMMDRASPGVEESRSNIPVLRAANKKSSDNNAPAETAARKRQRRPKSARKDSIDQEYRVKRVTEPLKPLEKRKDGTLIDYGLKVPTRRPKKQQQQQQPSTGEANPEKKNSAAHRHVDLAARDRKSSIPRKITSSSQQSLIKQVLRKSGENRRSNNSSSSKLTTSNCSGEERLVNSSPDLRSEQMFSQPPRDGCHCNCRSSTCAVGSAISASAERPEKQLIYAAWLNRRVLHAPRLLS